MVKVTVDIPKPLLKKMKHEAVDKETTLKEVIVERLKK